MSYTGVSSLVHSSTVTRGWEHVCIVGQFEAAGLGPSRLDYYRARMDWGGRFRTAYSERLHYLQTRGGQRLASRLEGDGVSTTFMDIRAAAHPTSGHVARRRRRRASPESERWAQPRMRQRRGNKDRGMSG